MTLPHVSKPQSTHWPPRGPARVLVVLDRPVLVELIKLTLHHGAYTTRTVTIANRVGIAFTEWQPHLAILDMDLDGDQIMAMLAANPWAERTCPLSV
jgi:DNA-binding response OmpR family regulator